MTDPIVNAETGHAQIAQGSHEDLRDAIISECAKVCFQALIDTYGLEKVVRMIGAHTKHSGMAMANNSRKRLNFVGNGPEQLATPFYWLHSGLSGGRIEMRVYQKGAVIELKDCPLKTAHPGLCVAASHFIGSGICEVINPAYEYVFTHHLTNGDPYCRAVIKKKEIRTDQEDLGELVRVAPSLGLPEDEMSYLRSTTIGETLIICTKVLLENDGKKILFDLVVPRMTMAGREVGERMGNDMEMNGRGGLNADTFAAILMKTFDLKTNSEVKSDREYRFLVKDCPFKTAPPEVCEQLTAFFDGIFNSIGCRYICQQRMSAGADDCQCSIQPFDAENKEKMNGPGEHIGSRLDILRDRLARGEITVEEFRTIRELVQE